MSTMSAFRSSGPLAPLHHACRPCIYEARSQLERSTWQEWVFLLSATVCLAYFWTRLAGCLSIVRQKGVVQTAFDTLKSLPGVSHVVRREQQKMEKKIRAAMHKDAEGRPEPFHALPAVGLAPDAITECLQTAVHGDVALDSAKVGATNRVSGTLYLAGDAHRRLLDTTYCTFAHTNPMHASVFPSVCRMEAEVVAMTADLLGGDPGVCGAVTSGGTESILSAVKAARDYMRAMRGICRPELVIGTSAHAAYHKAAEYFGLRLVTVAVGRDFRVSARAVRRALTRNTVMVVASAPCFPHGVIDDVEGIAQVAAAHSICCHVDACLGGFILPFARKLGRHVPPFDFEVRGVTSMSVDTHKFGQAHKGSSVVLYRSAAHRRAQYTRITDWSGGLYISPGFAGSRSGAIIATAWASMLHMGEAGYLAATQRILEAAEDFAAGVAAIPELALAGAPAASVVAFRAAKPRALSIYALNDALAARGWHLAALQRPPALHFCFTAQHIATPIALLQDLRECLAELRGAPQLAEGGMAPIYGLASASPDRALVGDFLVAYQDALLSL